MKYILMILGAMMSAPMHATTIYPPGTPASAIAVDQQVKREIAGKPGPVYCAIIDTRTGRCLQDEVLWAGGGSTAGNGAPASAPGAPGSMGATK